MTPYTDKELANVPPEYAAWREKQATRHRDILERKYGAK